MAPRIPDQGEVYAAVVTGLRDYVRKNGFRSVVLGLSGGIDSALVAAIACDAIGAQNVYGVSMPSSYSSEHSKSDARELAERTGLRFATVPIGPMVQAFLDNIELTGLAEENLQARARGVTLMGLSNQYGHLVLATGNKSELAVGYSTIYGDAVGGYAPLKDVPKTLVWELARWRNAAAQEKGETPPIPRRSIDKPPSAELRPGQLDADSLPDYAVLDDILDDYVEQDRSSADLVAAGFDPELVGRGDQDGRCRRVQASAVSPRPEDHDPQLRPRPPRPHHQRMEGTAAARTALTPSPPSDLVAPPGLGDGLRFVTRHEHIRVQRPRRHSTEERPEQPGDGAAPLAADQSRPEAARGVEGSTGVRADGQDSDGDRQADGERIDRRRSAAVDDGAVHHENEEERGDHLEHDADERVDVVSQGGRADGDGFTTDSERHDDGRDDPTKQLSDPVHTAIGRSIFRPSSSPSVMAGLKCPPDTCPNAATITPMARPCASASPVRSFGLLMAMMPMKHRVKTPSASAAALRTHVSGIGGSPIREHRDRAPG